MNDTISLFTKKDLEYINTKRKEYNKLTIEDIYKLYNKLIEKSLIKTPRATGKGNKLEQDLYALRDI